jgi:hypothetical protein
MPKQLGNDTTRDWKGFTGGLPYVITWCEDYKGSDKLVFCHLLVL